MVTAILGCGSFASLTEMSTMNPPWVKGGLPAHKSDNLTSPLSVS
jgi:hypothetical protein